MGSFRLTPKAKADLTEIRDYTRRTHGKAQCARYLLDLQTAFRQLAENPSLGRQCDNISPGLQRMEHAHHVVFFRSKPYGVRIVRVLHERMLPARHNMDDPEE